jgi:uncharacterized membrane protein YccC
MSRGEVLREGLKVALSMTLFYWLALSMDWDLPRYGALAIAVVSLGTAGASLQKGTFRVIGTTIGLAVGLIAIPTVFLDPIPFLVFQSLYLFVVGYLMQGSAHAYAWNVAGFLPILVWSSTYMHSGDAFHFAVFRYLETAAGVAIYTSVSVVLWPRRAGDALAPLGRSLLEGLVEAVRELRGVSSRAASADQLEQSLIRLDGLAARAEATLELAFYDSSGLSGNRAVWRSLRHELRTFRNALRLLRFSMRDCAKMDLDRVAPGVSDSLGACERRLQRSIELWDGLGLTSSTGPTPSRDDAPLLERALIRATPEADLAPVGRAAIEATQTQAQAMDESSIGILRALRALNGFADTPARPARSAETGRSLLATWSSERLKYAMIAPLCLALAYVLWRSLQPNGAPTIISIAGGVSLAIPLAPFPVLPAVVRVVVIVVVVIFPLYSLVMPRLHTGSELLILIFLYTLFACFVGTKNPLNKLFALVGFFMLTGISNRGQAFSFEGFSNAMVGIMLGMLVIMVVSSMMVPGRPEATIEAGLKRTLSACERFARALDGRRWPGARGRLRRRHLLRSVILSQPQALRTVAGRADRVDDAERARLEHLFECMQTIGLRLQAVDAAYVSYADASRDGLDPSNDMLGAVRDGAAEVFGRWRTLDRSAFADLGKALARLSSDASAMLERRLHENTGSPLPNAQDYILCASVRSLIEGMEACNRAINGVNWDTLLEPRFG